MQLKITRSAHNLNVNDCLPRYACVLSTPPQMLFNNLKCVLFWEGTDLKSNNSVMNFCVGRIYLNFCWLYGSHKFNEKLFNYETYISIIDVY